MRSKAGIYALYNETKQRYYIGQTSNLEKRKSTHFNNLKENNHPSADMQKDYNEGDVFSFMILSKCPDYERLLLSEEARYIKEYKAAGKNLYNTRDTIYNLMLNKEDLLTQIANKYCYDRFNKSFKQMTVGNNPARYDFLYRLFFEEGFDADTEKLNYIDIAFYYKQNNIEEVY